MRVSVRRPDTSGVGLSPTVKRVRERKIPVVPRLGGTHPLSGPSTSHVLSGDAYRTETSKIFPWTWWTRRGLLRSQCKWDDDGNHSPSR